MNKVLPVCNFIFILRCFLLFILKSDFEKAGEIHAQTSSESDMHKINGMQYYAVEVPSTACPSLLPAPLPPPSTMCWGSRRINFLSFNIILLNTFVPT